MLHVCVLYASVHVCMCECVNVLSVCVCVCGCVSNGWRQNYVYLVMQLSPHLPGQALRCCILIPIFKQYLHVAIQGRLFVCI